MKPRLVINCQHNNADEELLHDHHVHGFELELIVVYSGSTDYALVIAKRHGARTVTINEFSTSPVPYVQRSSENNDLLQVRCDDAIPG